MKLRKYGKFSESSSLSIQSGYYYLSKTLESSSRGNDNAPSDNLLKVPGSAPKKKGVAPSSAPKKKDGVPSSAPKKKDGAEKVDDSAPSVLDNARVGTPAVVHDDAEKSTPGGEHDTAQKGAHDKVSKHETEELSNNGSISS